MKNGVRPWISWENVHRDYSQVRQVPASVWKENPNYYIGLEFFRWVLVASSIIFFAFFGFADKARQHYRLVYTWLASRVGISTTASTTLHGSSHVYVFFFSISPPLNSQVILQHLSPSHEERRRHHGSRRHRRRRVQLDRLDIRPAVDPVHLYPNDYMSDLKSMGLPPLDSMSSFSVPMSMGSSSPPPSPTITSWILHMISSTPPYRTHSRTPAMPPTWFERFGPLRHFVSLAPLSFHSISNSCTVGLSPSLCVFLLTVYT